ncbi:MAG: A24 family peptidase [Actinobacteria bacterium]|nr:A24 family peptidase [Actinomycetota bacterium]
MTPQVFVGLVLAVSVAVGLCVTAWLRRGRHRRPDEQDLPRRSFLWVALLTPVAATVAAIGLVSRWPIGVAAGPVLFVLGWVLAAGVDADVGRLPNRLTVPLAGTALVWGVALAAVRGDVGAGVRTVLGAVALGGAYLALMALSGLVTGHGGGLGAGDAKLALSIGAVLGWFSWGSILGGFLLAFVLGAAQALVLVVARRARRSDAFSFGPAMAFGAALALVVA